MLHAYMLSHRTTPLLMINPYLILAGNGAVIHYSTTDGQEEEEASHSDDNGSSVQLLNNANTVSDVAVKEAKNSLPDLRSCQGRRSPRTRRRSVNLLQMTRHKGRHQLRNRESGSRT
ncbi:unnamed protein product [Haemonchus placei]|uniref:Uncharacterized protein n=1 Tax=Haemonchus placei TaxID=6290 RepID=A0A0N4WPQ8_HAEPC|nr:unnamed protein product [Haemonchus placei]